jgi:hypothetical protein
MTWPASEATAVEEPIVAPSAATGKDAADRDDSEPADADMVDDDVDLDGSDELGPAIGPHRRCRE